MPLVWRGAQHRQWDRVARALLAHNPLARGEYLRHAPRSLVQKAPHGAVDGLAQKRVQPWTVSARVCSCVPEQTPAANTRS